ncbi:zinc-ribbon domain-containing protein [Nocardioides sp.]|uniref:zinc-ribbon domain-containing protein n=1 Tax=Nocardioides sp. TaxID=35761 RepID=UPI0025EBCD0F|nr:zinc-ribbon domain-containing protein [Nocardioides sp.]
MSTTQPPARTGAQTALMALGALLMIGGLVCVVLGFAGFGSDDDLNQGTVGADLGLFAGGGLAMVVGLGIIGFTRARALMGRGGYARVTYEQGIAPGGSGSGGRFCSSCGRATSPSARFCDSCGAAVG